MRPGGGGGGDPAGLLRLGGGILGEPLSADRGHRGPRVPCGNGHEAVFAGYRESPSTRSSAGHRDAGLVPLRGLQARPGAPRRRARHRRHVDVAGPGRDERPGSGRQPVRRGRAAAGGAGRSPAHAKRVERAAEASGTAVAEAGRERARLIAARKLVPLPPSPLPDKLYAVIDGNGVPMTGKETAGRDGKGEDGRARTREVKLAVFFTQDKLDQDGYPVRDRATTSVIATFEPAATFGDLVKAEGIRRGADHVRQFTILGDGAAWIWSIATAKFPEATQVVDLFHAREHLHYLAR